MRTNPDLIEVVKGERGMLRGIEACISSQCLVSALTLVYSTIDALAALDRPSENQDSGRSDFKNWVERHLLPNSGFELPWEVLYGARCGILHTYSPDSSMARNGVEKIVYEWRAGPAAGAEVDVPADAVVIVVEDLLDALHGAIQSFLREIERDDATAGRVQIHSASLLCYRPWSPVPIPYGL